MRKNSTEFSCFKRAMKKMEYNKKKSDEEYRARKKSKEDDDPKTKVEDQS